MILWDESWTNGDNERFYKQLSQVVTWIYQGDVKSIHPRSKKSTEYDDHDDIRLCGRETQVNLD